MHVRHRLWTIGIAAAAGALTLSACSAGADQAGAGAVDSPAAASPSTGGESSGGAATLSEDSFVPSVQVKDVRTGEDVDLAGVVPSDTPVLLWAWAPHCPSCRAEAPAVEEFAARHRDDLTIVGIGTQDDLGFARDFVEDTGLQTPRMLWDPGFESWRAMGITAQPTMILVRGNGELIGGWVGALPEDIIESYL